MGTEFCQEPNSVKSGEVYEMLTVDKNNVSLLDTFLPESAG